ncbi:MAG: NusG domain II-containing protein, partial [Zoogloea sp.]|nr:NusG domain II-containing protein [Zoogloea sp.]
MKAAARLLAGMRGMRPLLRPGDFLVLAAGLAVCVASALLLWQGGRPDKAVVRAGGKVFGEYDLGAPRIVEVPGPLGTTRIEIQPGRARVASDPGPRQYCVRQGWLNQAGAVAICAPNQVSLSLSGRGAAG